MTETTLEKARNQTQVPLVSSGKSITSSLGSSLEKNAYFFDVFSVFF